MRLIKTIAIAGALLVTMLPGVAGPAAIKITRAFSPQYKNAKILKVVTVIRPETESIVMGFQPRQPGLPEMVIIHPYYEMDADKLMGADGDGRSWIIEKP